MQESYFFYELFPMLLIALIGGLLGSLFNHLNSKITAWRKANLWVYGTKFKILDAIGVAVITSTVAFTLPLFFQCKVSAAPRAHACHSWHSRHLGIVNR
jgi:chloride channel 7